jgi:hypothetical protein
MDGDYITPEEAAELVRAANMQRGRGRRASVDPPSGLRPDAFGPIEAGEYEEPPVAFEGEMDRLLNPPATVVPSFNLVPGPAFPMIEPAAPTTAPILLAIEFKGEGMTLLTNNGTYTFSPRERERLVGLCADVIKRTTQEFMKSLDSWGTKPGREKPANPKESK